MDEATQTIRALRSRLCLSHGMRGRGQNPDQRALFMGVRGGNWKPDFGDAFKQRGLIPKPDSVLVSDIVWISRTRPAIPHGLRGRLGVLLGLETGHTDVHSGVTGGTTHNPLAEYVWSLCLHERA